MFVRKTVGCFHPVRKQRLDDSWLNVTAEDVDDMMQASSVLKGGISQDLDLQDVADSMSAFVSTVSSVDGAEFPR